MTNISLDDVTAALKSTRVTPSGVSFAGRSLALNDVKSAQEIVDAILNCTDLEYLNLEGNTLGVEAAHAIAKALEKHPEFKKAIWKDMFTGRLKTEIPQALKHLGDGLVTAGSRLTELDLSDNAFGPIGVEGLAALLRSPTCYALEELKLNNNGLGIGGGKLLAGALMDCYNSSKNAGQTFALKVFIAGRNRLENDGARALAQVFKKLGTLEEISMPQNGIYHVGISALSDAFAVNKNLQILNLNDNTITWKGAQEIAAVLPKLQKLRVINFGDSLLKTKGALSIASAIQDDHLELQELILGFNEIGAEGGIILANAVANKTKLKSLVLDGNQFNEKTRSEIQKILKQSGRFNALTSLDECDSEEEEECDDTDDVESEKDLSDGEEVIDLRLAGGSASYEKFINNSIAENFVNLGSNKDQLILSELKKCANSYRENLILAIMKVSALSNTKDDNVKNSVTNCSLLLYKELFEWAEKNNDVSVANNSLLVHLGLIKGEDKSFKVTWNTASCFSVLEAVLQERYVPENTKDTLRFFMGKKVIELNDSLKKL